MTSASDTVQQSGSYGCEQLNITMEIEYPRKKVTWQEVANQNLFEQATASLFAWQQGIGQFGGLHLHPCWQESSVLTRQYQGQGLHLYGPILSGAFSLFERFRDPRWQTLADDVARNLLLLQQSEGGFRHGSSEFEPAYGCLESCPIQQGMAMLALLDYAAWPHAIPSTVKQIPDVFARFWRWFNGFFWRRGNAWIAPLPFDAFCGVTNQDLVICAVLAKAQTLYGGDLYDRVGAPVLETYLSPRYYHEKVGLFERGDQENFVERTGYYGIILAMLRRLYAHTQDGRLLQIHDNVAFHLFDAMHTASDGLVHFAWGAATFPDDKTRVAGWKVPSIGICLYPELLVGIQDCLRRHPSESHRAQYEAVQNTFAAYIFADGSLPIALNPDSEVFHVVSSVVGLWSYLIHDRGAVLHSPATVTQPCIHRRCGSTVWKTAGALWAIEQNRKRVYTGFRYSPGAVYAGAGVHFRGLDLSELDRPQLIENVQLLPVTV